jgi:phage tail-like protein
MPRDPYDPGNLNSGLTDRQFMLASKFGVMIQNIEVGYFLKVSGFSVNTECDAFYEGGENRFKWYLPNHTDVQKQIVLERGVFVMDLLWEWYQEMVEDGILVPRTVHIQAYENIQGPSSTAGGTSPARRMANPLVTWTLEQALPINWQGLQFDATRPDAPRLVERVTFICKRLIHGLVDTQSVTGDSKDTTASNGALVGQGRPAR